MRILILDDADQDRVVAENAIRERDLSSDAKAYPLGSGPTMGSDKGGCFG